MYKLLGSLALVALIFFYCYKNKTEIESLEQKNKSLKTELKVCKSSKDAKDFELKWSDEFFKGLSFESEIKDENISTENDTNNTFSDTF